MKISQPCRDGFTLQYVHPTRWVTVVENYEPDDAELVEGRKKELEREGYVPSSQIR